MKSGELSTTGAEGKEGEYMWRINKGQREEIKVELYDVWKDGSVWKVKLPLGVDTFKTKRMALKLVNYFKVMGKYYTKPEVNKGECMKLRDIKYSKKVKPISYTIKIEQKDFEKLNRLLSAGLQDIITGEPDEFDNACMKYAEKLRIKIGIYSK